MDLPKLTSVELSGKRVIVRSDLDVPFENGVVTDPSRLAACIPTFKHILAGGAKSLMILGHIGKYEGPEKTVSTSFLQPKLQELLGENVTFVSGMPPASLPEGKVFLLDNVRMDKGEEENNEEFTGKLASLADFYVNESFATSHRVHASLIGLPKLLPHAAGIRLAEEVEKLSKIREKPERPLIALISGIKKDKLNYIQNFLEFSDKVLIAGRLPDYLADEDPLWKNPKVMIARLIPDKEDITISTIERFTAEINKAKTIVVAGVLGKFEEEGHRQGTQEVFTAVANSSAFKLLGGGDSESAISMFKLHDKFNWISIGGGAMLEFLSKGALPAIEALKS